MTSIGPERFETYAGNFADVMITLRASGAGRTIAAWHRRPTQADCAALKPKVNFWIHTEFGKDMPIPNFSAGLRRQSIPWRQQQAVQA